LTNITPKAICHVSSLGQKVISNGYCHRGPNLSRNLDSANPGSRSPHDAG
jgi:hypothetical protein